VARGVSLRALLIGLVAVVAVCAIVSWAELVITYIQIGILQFPPVVVGLLVFVALVNAAVRRAGARAGLTPAEIMVIYLMMLVAAMIASRGLMEKLLPALVGVNYYATLENNWRNIFFPHLQSWMVPFDRGGPENQEVARQFYEGLHPGEPVPWGAWTVPLLGWGVLVALILTSFLCLAAILRRQWVDNEKLAFPLAQLPLEMVREETAGPFLRNPLTWVGFALPAIVFAVNGLHMIYPALPEISLSRDLNQYLTTAPWNQIEFTTVYFSFAVIGFSYLLPLDLLFSLWFFFVINRLEDIPAYYAGLSLDPMPLYPTRVYKGYQVMGAYLVLVIYLVRMSWPHLRAVFRKAAGLGDLDDSGELLPYRTAVIGLLLSTTGAVVWCYLAGMTLWVAVLEMVVYLFVVVLVMARSVAEGGLLMTETSFRPLNVAQLFMPKSALGPGNLAALSLVDAVFARDLRGLLLTGFLDGQKIADGVRLRRRSLLWAFVPAIIVALLAAGFIEMVLPYRRGAVTMYYYPYVGNSLWGFQDNAAAIASPTHFDWRAPTFFLVGAGFTAFLAVMRASFAWFPFHPLGYALSASWSLIVFWFPFLVAWVLKVLILRYGGMKLYRRLRPAFLGLVLGEFTSAVGWTVFSFITRQPAPFFPWP
jgi:hypothetical protein